LATSSGGRVVGDGVESRHRARGHPEEARDPAGPRHRRRVALDVHVAVRELRREARRRERDHRVHLRDARARAA
jgi:hypothetical protein